MRNNFAILFTAVIVALLMPFASFAEEQEPLKEEDLLKKPKPCPCTRFFTCPSHYWCDSSRKEDENEGPKWKVGAAELLGYVVPSLPLWDALNGEASQGI